MKRISTVGTFRQDSRALAGAFNILRNELTGMGTGADKNSYTELNPNVIQLPQQTLRNLPRQDGIIRRALFLHVEDGFRGNWYNLDVGNNKTKPEKIKEYIKKIKGGVRSCFSRAAALGRQHGDGFILLGIADGQTPDKPVREDRIESVRWVKVVTKYELFPETWEGGGHDPEYYKLYLFNDPLPEDNPSGKRYNDMLWHKSRVLRFSGSKLYDDALGDNGGYHDSIIQAMFNAWMRWESGLTSSAGMLADYSEFSLGIKDLAENFDPNTNTPEQIEKAQSAVIERGRTVNLGRSTLKAILYDLENELPGTITRSYAGADEIMGRLETSLAAVATIPTFKLFNQVGSTGLANGVQQALILKSEWGIQNQSWMDDTVREPLETIVKYCQFAKDSPTRGQVNDTLEVQFPLNIVLSPVEIAEMQKMTSERDEKNIKCGIYTGAEARIIYERAEFNPNLTLKPLVGNRTPTIEELKDIANPTPKPASPSKNQSESNMRTDDGSRAKKYIEWQGFKIGLQYLPFDERHGKTLSVGYGWVANTRSKHDGLACDAYVVPNPSEQLYVVDQYINGDFDEEKFIVGATSLRQAADVYLSAMPEEMLGNIKEVPIQYLKRLSV